MRKLTIPVVLVLLAALAVMPSTAKAVAVDLELALLVDVSGSVDSTEYNLQMQGYIDAFNSAAVQNKIAAGSGVAVCMVQWAGTGSQSKVVDWALITDQASSQAFATSLGSVVRAFSGSGALTAPGSAINFAVPLFTGNGFEGTRLAIDVSGDGSQNDPTNPNPGHTNAARDAAALAGITINGLAIQNEEPALAVWYANNLKTTDGFVVAVDTFDDFGAAVQQKIITEVTGAVPEPITMGAMFLGVAGLAGYVRRRRAA
jgi:hypothetical protein